MTIPYATLVNEQPATSVSSESHLVGIIGVSTYNSGTIRLIQVPESTMPSSVSITGSGGPYNEITSGTPTGGQFLVDYTTGVITFAISQNGNTVLVSYNGLGSEFAAENVNEVQDPLASIATLTLTYHSPYTSASASWGLTLSNADIFVGNSSNIATAVSLSGDATLANTGALTLSTVNSDVGTFNYATVTVNGKGLVTAVSSGTAPVTYTAGTGLTLTGSQFSLTTPVTVVDGGTGTTTSTGTGSVVLSNIPTLVSPNLGTPNSGNLGNCTGLSLTTGVTGTLPIGNGGTNNTSYTTGSIIFYNGTSLSQDNTNLFWTSSTHQLGIGTDSPNASALVDMESTTLGFLPPQMTSTQRTAISSPAAGLMVYDTTTNQWYGWNGTSWVILG